MKYLIKNNSFENDIFVSYNKTKKLFSKFGFSKESNLLLENEIKGIKWYNDNFPTRINLNYQYLSENYSKIEISKINGRKINYFNNFSKNYKFIETFYNFYFDYWPKSDSSPIHGDLTFDNIFFLEDKIIIFDWEHFDINGSNYGYDLVYFILSTFFLPIMINKKIKKLDVLLFKKIWKKIHNSIIDKKLLNDPFQYFETFYNKKNSWINAGKPHKDKYLINMLNENNKDNFFKIICENN